MRAGATVGLALALAVATATLAGCTKEEPKSVKEEPKKSTPVPEDMGSFNDFLPAGGGAAGLAVKLDGGLEGGLAAIGDGGAVGAAGEPPPGAGPDNLKVLEAGAEPRAARRYAFVANRTDKRLLTIAQEQSRGGQGQGLTLTILMDLTPKQVKPASAHIEAKVSKVDLPGAAQGAQQQAQLAQALAGMNGLTGTFDVTARGEFGEVAFAADAKMQNPLAESVLQGLQQAIELMLPPLPEAPVGAGAKWERTVDRAEGGIAQQAKHVFTLREVNNEGGVVDSEIAIHVPKRTVQARGIPATIWADGKGKYTYQFRFDRVSTKVVGEITLNQHIEVADPSGKKQQMDEISKAKHTFEVPPAK